ncbi:MAG TPA: CotH kinase family protein, partial [Myxococcota bacterium]|nr:CotH kinase family protein [Myxococcota bacterium]
MRVLEGARPTAWTRLFGARGARVGLRLAFAAALGLAFLLGAAAQSTGFWGVIVRPALEAGVEAPLRWVRARLANPRRITVDLAFDDYQRLALQRERALAAQALFASEDDYVSARLATDGKEARVKLRLKGDSAAHLQGEKWSFRVDVKGGDTVLGLQRFSLHHPATRNYVSEWLYHRALAREDIVSLLYEFVEVTLNGKDLGIYALEEHFEKQLIERNRRREGPILRLDEELMWREAHHLVRSFRGADESGYGAYEASAVDGFKSGQLLADPVAAATFTKAAALLDAFRRGELATSEVFDVERLATYFALTDLLGAEHGARWHNLRFYFNPVTSRLEPIGFDAECKPTQYLSGIEATIVDGHTGKRRVLDRPLHERLFADAAFRARYFAELERVSEPAYVDALFRDLAPQLAAATSVLHREFLQIDSPEPLVRRNQAYLRALLRPHRAIRAGVLTAEDGGLHLEVGNLQSMPIELLAVGPAGGALAKLDPTVVLAPRRFGELVAFAKVSLPAAAAKPAAAPAPLRLRWRIPGTSRVVEEDVAPSPWSALAAVAVDVTRKAANLARFPFIELAADGTVAQIRPGAWTLREDLVVPPGLTLRAGPGTRIDLVARAKVFSRSPLEWIGTQEEPIELVSSDGTGEGLIVANARETSRFEHVRFEGLRSSSADGYALTGALTFFEAPVEMRFCELARNR